VAKPKSKSAENGESDNLPAVQVNREKLVADLTATKRSLLEKKKAIAGGTDGQQQQFLAKYGPCDRVSHDHVEALGRIMGQLAVIRQRSGHGAYGESGRAHKILDTAIQKLAEVQGLLTSAAAVTMAQTLFPDRFDSGRDDYDEQIRAIDESLRELKSKKLDPDQLEDLADTAQVAIQDARELLDEEPQVAVAEALSA
jgi:hypothetical protein